MLERDDADRWIAYEVLEREIEKHCMAIESARNALRGWRNAILSGAAASAEPPPRVEED